MPSGAKKRKAAKKRNETHTNNNPNPSVASTQGGGDVKHQDDRQSDVGEASSIASQNPSHHDLLIKGEEEKIENSENVSNLPPVEGVKNNGGNKHGIMVEGVEAPVEREFKIEDEFDRINGTFEHDETKRKSHVGGSSSSSSSDDESHAIKKSQTVDTASVSVKVDNSLHESNIEPVAPSVVEPVIKENEEKKGSLEKEATIPSVEKITTTYNPKGAVAEEDTGVNEPLLVPPPRPVETTSWKGCCGLFELFTGSGR